MLRLALDQATHTTGWSLWTDEHLTTFGKVVHDNPDIFKRIHKFCLELQILILKYKPDEIILEDIQMQGMVNNVSTFQKLAWLQGALIETCLIANVPVKLIRPSEWRAVCNLLKGQDKHRENQKKVAQEWVRNKFNITCTQDEADAICIGYASAGNEMNWE